MGMFTSYECLEKTYVTPNNIKPEKSCEQESNITSCRPRKPYEDCNVKGELTGYWWNYGDTINLDFHITGDIVVEDDAIVYTAINDKPTEETIGVAGQKAYNITDLKSWTCDIIDNVCIWVEDEEFTNPEAGSRNIYVSAEEYVKNRYITFTLYNFRMEEIDKQTFEGATDIIYEINEELSNKLVKGVYYGKLTLWEKNIENTPKLIFTLFDSTSCTFTVK